MNLTTTQQRIVDTNGNLVVSSSAGTGKTHTLVAKIAKELNQNQNQKVIAAITFTIKAAKEIRDRLSIDTGNSFIGTNNSFAIEEVIMPFIKDAFGKNFDIKMTIDYQRSFGEFNEGLKLITEESIIGKYKDNKKNFIFELALKVLTKSEVARLYLRAKYFKIYVDEYQDCDKNMHDFFMYLTNNLNINLFLVGDDKQALYIWRGARPEIFANLLENSSFNSMHLEENFRSNKQIQNYGNVLFDQTAGLYERQDNLSHINLVECTWSNWQEKLRNFWHEDSTSVLLRTKNTDAKENANELVENDMNFKFVPRPPIAEIANSTTWIYYSIAQYVMINTYSIYDFIYDIPYSTQQNKNQKSIIKKYLDNIIRFRTSKEKFFKAVVDFINFLGYESQLPDLERLYTTLSDSEFKDAFLQNQYKHRAMTCHAAKGLQFDQVIIFAEDFSFNYNDDLYKYYVAVTRAKNQLIIIDTSTFRSRHNLSNLENLLQTRELNINELLTVIPDNI